MLKLSEAIVLGIAARRGTEAWLDDSITEGARLAYLTWCANGGPLRARLADLAECPYCAGFWLSAVTYAAYAGTRRKKGTPLEHVMSVWAVAGVQALLQRWIEWVDENQEQEARHVGSR